MKRIAAVLILAVAGGLLAVPSAMAEEFTCRGTVGATTLDNVRVPQGATCVLVGTKVKGTIKVENRATLRARNVDVIGNVQGENAAAVNVVRGSEVGGSVQVVQGAKARVVNSHVNGDIQYDENDGVLKVLRNRVGGNVQVVQNTGGAEIRGNRIGGNLQCKQNNPPPTGGNNTVDGSKEGQCASL